jgi:hypothetical protein
MILIGKAQGNARGERLPLSDSVGISLFWSPIEVLCKPALREGARGGLKFPALQAANPEVSQAVDA